MKNRIIALFAVILAVSMTAAAFAVTSNAVEDEAAASAAAEDTVEEETASSSGKRSPKGERSASGKKSGDVTSESAPDMSSKKEKTTEPEGVIGKDDAKEAALLDAGIEAEGKVRARYSEKDGVSYYSVRFTAGGLEYKYHIDAFTGAVLEKSAEEITADESSETKSGKKDQSSKKTETAEPEGVIGKDAAKEAALLDAGAEAEGKVRARYSEKDGVSYYSVRFTANGQKYKYHIDAFTGAVLEKTAEEIAE